MLIDLYEKYRPQVGTMKIKNFKAMWEFISKDLSDTLNQSYSPTICENKWKVLERNYKKYVDNKTSTGRGRKYFEYAEEMERVLGKKKNCNPELLLGAETIHVPNNMDNIENVENNENERLPLAADIPEMEKRGKEIRRKNISRKKSVLEKIREDRKQYQEKRLQQEEEKIKIMQKRNELLEKKLNSCTCNGVNRGENFS